MAVEVSPVVACGCTSPLAAGAGTALLGITSDATATRCVVTFWRVVERRRASTIAERARSKRSCVPNPLMATHELAHEMKYDVVQICPAGCGRFDQCHCVPKTYCRPDDQLRFPVKELMMNLTCMISMFACYLQL